MATNVTEKDKTLNEIIDWAKSRCHEAALSRFDVRRKSDRDFYDGQVNAFHEILRGRLMMISQYDKDMCCLYIAEGMNYIWQQRENQELSRILESLADRKLMKRVHGGYAITLKGLLAVKVWRLHLFLFHHDECKYFRRKK